MLIHSTHPGLRRTAFILVTLLIFIPVTACSSGDSYRQISPPISSSELEGKDYKDIVTASRAQDSLTSRPRQSRTSSSDG